jgi:hypothetical protein
MLWQQNNALKYRITPCSSRSSHCNDRPTTAAHSPQRSPPIYTTESLLSCKNCHSLLKLTSNNIIHLLPNLDIQRLQPQLQTTHRNHGLQPLLPRRRRPPPQHLHPHQVLPHLRRPHRSNRLPARQRRPLVLQLSVLPPRPLAERRARQVLGHCPRRSQGYCA